MYRNRKQDNKVKLGDSLRFGDTDQQLAESFSSGCTGTPKYIDLFIQTMQCKSLFQLTI